MIMRNEHKTEKDGIRQEPLTPGKTADDSSPGRAVFDWDALLYRLMGDEALAEEIVGDFLRQIPENLDSLKQALDKKDMVLIKREAHIIKGAAGNVGAVVLQEIAEKIETAGDLAEAQIYFAEFNTQRMVLQNEYDRLFR